jgi:ABC-type transport system substrate-binding protein
MLGSGTKKIITIGSAVVSLLIIFHLIGVYIFIWGHYEWVKWGSISIGIADTTPNPLDPFQYGKNDSTDLLYRFLFRGLIRYDAVRAAYQWDLTTCDLADIQLIRCTLRDDAVWSDGTRVKTDDIVASFDAFKKSASNQEIRAFFETVTIKKNGDSVEIKSGQKSPHMIEILTYPIIKSDVIVAIYSGTITTKNYSTSGPYTFGEKITDKEYWFDRITLVRNEKWAWSTWLDKIHFKFFRDVTSLERSAETLTIVIPPVKNEKIDMGPRFREYLYTNYEYFSVFLNTKSMGRMLRNSLHWQIGTSFSGSIVVDHKRTNTIFIDGPPILPTGNLKWFSDILRELGYAKKSEIISKINQTNSTIVSGELVLKTAKYWNNKADVTTLFVNEAPNEIILTWTVPLNTQSVTINWYTLKEFVPGNTSFSYKISTIWGTLVEGKNTYTLSLIQNNGKTETEDLTLYVSVDIGKINEYKKVLLDEYIGTQNTPALIANRERLKEEKLLQSNELKDEYYYNNLNQVFSIKIGYIIGPQSTEIYAKNIDSALRLLGIKTELIPYNPKEIQSLIANGDRKYDILVIGVSVEWSLSNIGQLFLNNWGKTTGINFSSIENRSLENLFEELRWTTEINKIETIEQAIGKIMNTESFFIPVSSPYHRIWVDRNIKGIPKVDLVPDITSFVDVFVNTSIKENYIRNMQNKNVSEFFSWIISKL